MILAAALVMAMAEPGTYLAPIVEELVKEWPANRTVNIVCHGHSVPAGYFATPAVDSLNAYPHLVHAGLTKRFPHAVINVIVTAIGGENSLAGAKRFAADVLPHRPDVVLIDYGLNDRPVPLAESRKAWTSMVRSARASGARVLLLTPTPDLGASMADPNDPLSLQAAQVREIALAEGVGLVDPYSEFQGMVSRGISLAPFMSQSNHPNRRGHDIVARLVLSWFPEPK
ncbi:MAG TPA: SGNH/GDSL hydrolase family protein [Fimbriimonas sp.]